VDLYLLALLGCVIGASIAPAQSSAAQVLDVATDAAIVLLFFLYGARLSPKEAWEGARNFRLQGSVLAFTYALFPALAWIVARVTPGLPSELRAGLIFLGALPSTVQSSIAFTSIARGNVAAAITAASVSNLLGVVATPLLLTVLMARGSGASFSAEAVEKLALQLLLPFFLGQVLRPLLAGFVARHRRVLSFVDRGSILLVVYAAFSAGVNQGIWHMLSPRALGLLLLVNAALLAAVLWTTTQLSRRIGFSKEDEISAVFCGSKKSLASGLPMASVLFPPGEVGMIVLPLMLFHQLQLMACAWLARRYAER
jgi:sodium/bile acid cotransporter 7